MDPPASLEDIIDFPDAFNLDRSHESSWIPPSAIQLSPTNLEWDDAASIIHIDRQPPLTAPYDEWPREDFVDHNIPLTDAGSRHQSSSGPDSSGASSNYGRNDFQVFHSPQLESYTVPTTTAASSRTPSLKRNSSSQVRKANGQRSAGSEPLSTANGSRSRRLTSALSTPALLRQTSADQTDPARGPKHIKTSPIHSGSVSVNICDMQERTRHMSRASMDHDQSAPRGDRKCSTSMCGSSSS